MPAIHDVEWRTVRASRSFEHAVELEVPRLRVAYAYGGPKLELLSWLEPYARVTQRLAETVSRLCAVMSIHHVAQFWPHQEDGQGSTSACSSSGRSRWTLPV